MLKFNQYMSESRLCSRCEVDPCICDDSHGFVTEAVDKGEYDYEGQMARTQLQTTMRNCRDMIAMLKDDDNMPEWVQSKITLAQDYITSVRDYLQSKEELGEEIVTESLDTHEMAMAHKDKASKALETSDMKSYHTHMSNHHESMGQWHESKGRHSAADREYAKSEEHHEKSLKPDNSKTVGAKNEQAVSEAIAKNSSDEHDIDSLQKHFGPHVAYAAASHSPAMMMRKDISGKSHTLIKQSNGKYKSVKESATRELDGVKKKTNEALAESSSKHRVGVTVSEKDHPMVSKRLEKQQKFVKVSAGSKEEAVTKAKKFYSKQGYHVHGAEYHSAMTVKEELDEAATSAAVRMQKALEKIKADRERKERLAEPYVATKSVFKKPIKEVIAGNLSCMSCGDTPCQCDSHTQMVETGKRKSFKRFTKDSKR